MAIFSQIFKLGSSKKKKKKKKKKSSQFTKVVAQLKIAHIFLSDTIVLTVYLIGSINGKVLVLANQQIVLMAWVNMKIKMSETSKNFCHT